MKGMSAQGAVALGVAEETAVEAAVLLVAEVEQPLSAAAKTEASKVVDRAEKRIFSPANQQIEMVHVVIYLALFSK